jgi:hypothetical protein
MKNMTTARMAISAIPATTAPAIIAVLCELLFCWTDGAAVADELESRTVP